MLTPDFDALKNVAMASSKVHFKDLPKEIGPYKIESLLRKGGMSYLFLGLHPETKEPITIKVLFPEFLSNPEMVQRFSREADIIALADHPNIVKLYGQGQWEGGLYIAMEYIQGVSLRQYLTRNLISLKHALEIVMEISMALCHLHVHGVIHRDLKPENILITETEGVKVIDFGIAQLLTSPETDTASKRRLIGTPIYMSPEQKEDPESTSYPSDIYSLGIITYELVLGKLSHGQIHLAIMPKGLQKILTKALQSNPEDRYQDIVDFMSDISDYLHSPAFQKENKELTPLSDLSESLRHAQSCLVPQYPPYWTGIQIGFGSYKTSGTSSLYYDFFSLPKGAYGIILGEPSVKGSPGIVYSSVLRGMVRSLCQLTSHPQEMATVLNALLLDDPMKQHFAFSYLVLLPSENLFRFISCGCGHLQLIKTAASRSTIISSHTPLGVERETNFTEIEQRWDKNDTLFLSGSSSHHVHPSKQDLLFTNEQLDMCLNEAGLSDTQRLVNTMLRKAKFTLSRPHDERAAVLIGLKKE